MSAMKSAPVQSRPFSPLPSPVEASIGMLAQSTFGGPFLRSPAAPISPRSRLLSALPEEPSQQSPRALMPQHLQAPEKAATPSAMQPLMSLPRLLGQEPLAIRHGASIEVKNTFIDVDSDGENDAPQFEKMKSAPVRPSPLSPQGEVSPCLPRSAAWQPSGMLSPQREEDEEGDMVEPLQDYRPAPANMDESPIPAILPLQLRHPEQSEGSALHNSGQCKPCAWFWRPQGCFNSVDCAHCHMCLPGELKKLKKARQQAMRGTGHQRIGRKTSKPQAVVRAPVHIRSQPTLGTHLR